MDAEQQLLTTPPADWRIAQVIAFDWYDGPRQGVCRLEVPEVEFVFRLLNERFVEDDGDDRVFAVEALPPGSVARALEALEPFGTPLNAVWVPVMRHPDRSVHQQTKTALEAIERQATPTPVVFYTRDFETFLGRWHAGAAGDGDRPWFRLIDGKDTARRTAEATP